MKASTAKINNPIPKSELISCPVCESICTEPPLYHYTAAEAASHFCPITRNAERNKRLEESIRRLWQDEPCKVLRCADCGFAFGVPFISGDKEFYRILHEEKDYPNWRWDYDVALSEVLNQMNGGRILDIGAGAGVFLRSLSAEWEPYAVEGSELTRADLESKGIHVFRSLAEAARLESGTFHVITLFQVLEHLAEFRDVLEQCHQLLVTGGRLVVTVPDGDAMIRQERLTGCHDMPPNHINKWTPESLSRAFHKAGFRSEQAIYEPSSLTNIKSNIHLKLMADAVNQKSASAQIYRIKNRQLRILGLACLSLPALLRMLPSGSSLWSGGAFALVGLPT